MRPPGALDGGKKRPGGALLRRDLRQDLSVPRRLWALLWPLVWPWIDMGSIV